MKKLHYSLFHKQGIHLTYQEHPAAESILKDLHSSASQAFASVISTARAPSENTFTSARRVSSGIGSGFTMDPRLKIIKPSLAPSAKSCNSFHDQHNALLL